MNRLDGKISGAAMDLGRVEALVYCLFFGLVFALLSYAFLVNVWRYVP